jgi:hypothetical protein
MNEKEMNIKKDDEILLSSFYAGNLYPQMERSETK